MGKHAGKFMLDARCLMIGDFLQADDGRPAPGQIVDQFSGIGQSVPNVAAERREPAVVVTLIVASRASNRLPPLIDEQAEPAS